ncbi:methylmalonyl-CoA mutase family protein [Pseudobacteriovorax antillogorgiicola]|uniref:Fused isobutyryl-CoA mutase n=1 Tax=Pseudobacteriovorax antillogorgiicola TaxID=1513793 RepID=A0A1Y6CRW5_9BACT|nr:methylmalonyl-CoA mutase family protein [Pseudobacteriovorax antillogorgiicola]TCS41173.1 methylmalonyl-CoA mutase [Pseudobacteriovorax antillogorgiicola]SMF83919.1 methylmalonyl-CoA mutase [Pseudobacteriovorax antillogorgiicola]
MSQADQVYKPKNHIRIVTAASLFDGHDAAINIMRRILQASGAEVIHLGHNRSVAEIVDCAIAEDAQGIAITSYQGGHVEFFKYMHDLLKERNAPIKLFGGGGGTILPSEIEELHNYGVCRIYSPDDGRTMGLQGMINHLLEECDFCTQEPPIDDALKRVQQRDPKVLAKLISVAENFPDYRDHLSQQVRGAWSDKTIPVLGITGTGGAGKSSLVDELVRRFLDDFEDKTIAIISVDPSKRKSGGALLGDRIRMNAIHHPRVFMRSLATRQSNLALSKYVQDSIDICKAAAFDLIIVETSGIGQSDTEITEHSDVSLYVMTSEYGAATQLEKIDMLDFADLIAINKFDKRGALDALRDVRKQYRRNHNLWDGDDEALPVFGTMASQFNDPGMNTLYRKIMDTLDRKVKSGLQSAFKLSEEMSKKKYIIPPDRVRYLAEICESSDQYRDFVDKQAAIARQLYQLSGAIQTLRSKGDISIKIGDILPELEACEGDAEAIESLLTLYKDLSGRLDHECRKILGDWAGTLARYKADQYSFQVRDKVIKQDLYHKSLSGLKVPKVSLPKYQDWGDILRWVLTENVPGSFPYAAGVFPLKREGEDPARMFAGEGGPERTNRRFHYVSKGMPAKRLSTAFDSVTLYGEDPDFRPDIYGKVGNSGVSICTLDDAKKLYSGFNLADPRTSVSMTINGPAPMLLGFFLNAAVDQQCELYIRENGLKDKVESKINDLYKSYEQERPRYQGELPEGNDGLGLMLLGVHGKEVLPAEVYDNIKQDTLQKVRGTVQADILKEDQAQNTCIFSTEFALRLMGDIQEYFIDKKVRNFYSVSISGYHIAEAGANPITQLAFTLANGFTYVEYYLSRGMNIDDFAPNLSFFFSNGIDPEYSVIGRVARRIWAKAMKHKYHGNSRSQKLKYHIQTSGRSLHAQEIAFNDIRTTLQALYAIYDNCNSLHTNAYDEAITTPTEESVRRAMAIQLIINKELGLARNENPIQGSFIIEELTDLVEQAVLYEFRSISERGGVLGAMERMYQRMKIQDESHYYESLKHSGEMPIIGVNTFLSKEGSPTVIPSEVIRADETEKKYAISSKEQFQRRNTAHAERVLQELRRAALDNQNMFDSIMEASKYCSLGQISQQLYEVGGQYRRNM